MIRGLVNRQVLGVVEGALWLTLVAIGASALYGIVTSGGSVDITPINPQVDAVELQSPVEDRAHYELITQSRLFGDAGSYVHNPPKTPEAPPPPPPPADAVETKLPLELKGVTYLGEDSSFSSVMINVKEKGVGERTFFIGEEVIDNVFLTKISKEEAELDNKRANRREKLAYKLETAAPGGSRQVAMAEPELNAVRPTAPESRERPVTPSLVTLSRDDIVQKLEDDYERLASTVDVKEVKDEDGNVKGLTADNIESIPSLNELGFKNGDVLVSINNEKVQSQNQITEIANKYRNATIVRVGILRQDQPMTFTYRIR